MARVNMNMDDDLLAAIDATRESDRRDRTAQIHVLLREALEAREAADGGEHVRAAS